MQVEIGNVGLRIGRGQIGIIDIWAGRFVLSFGVEKSFRCWGLSWEWYDGWFGSFGIGPLLCVTWTDA